MVMYQMKTNGRVSVCGSISSYNADAKSLPKGILFVMYVYSPLKPYQVLSVMINYDENE